jgi:hypothetical protein
MTHKVKYTRKEYREEYLQSEEWKSLRTTIMDAGPNCQCCDQKATDVHHLVYRNIVDIKITDLLPVCRNCHDLIHQAIRDGWISQEIKDLEDIKQKTLNIKNDEQYKEHAKWLAEKHILDKEDRDAILYLQGFVIQKISALVRKNVWHDKLEEMKFTGRQILSIKEIIKVAKFRREHKIDIRRKSILKPRKHGVLSRSKRSKRKK